MPQKNFQITMAYHNGYLWLALCFYCELAGDSVHSSHSKKKAMLYPKCLVLPIIGPKGKRDLDILQQLLRLKYKDEKHHNLLARSCNWKKNKEDIKDNFTWHFLNPD